MAFKFSQATIVDAPDGGQWVVRDMVDVDDERYAPIGKRGRMTKDFLRFLKAGRQYSGLTDLIKELQYHRTAGMEKALKAENPFERDASAGAMQSLYAARANRKRLKQLSQNKVPVVMLPAFYNTRNELVDAHETKMPAFSEHFPNNERKGGLLLQLDEPTLHWVKERFSVLVQNASPCVYKNREQKTASAGVNRGQKTAAAGVLRRHDDHANDDASDDDSDDASASAERSCNKSTDAMPRSTSSMTDVADAVAMSGNASSSPPGVDAETVLENASSSSQLVHAETSLKRTSSSSEPTPSTTATKKYFPMFLKSVTG